MGWCLPPLAGRRRLLHSAWRKGSGGNLSWTLAFLFVSSENDSASFAFASGNPCPGSDLCCPGVSQVQHRWLPFRLTRQLGRQIWGVCALCSGWSCAGHLPASLYKARSPRAGQDKEKAIELLGELLQVDFYCVFFFLPPFLFQKKYPYVSWPFLSLPTGGSLWRWDQEQVISVTAGTEGLETLQTFARVPARGFLIP